MILVIGGAFQGKLKYVSDKFSLTPGDIDDGSLCSTDGFSGARCLNNFHLLAFRLASEGKDTEDFLKNIRYEIIISDETGGGIVPADEKSRRMREISGRLLCRLAETADSVVRVHCGIPVAIKGALP